MPAPRRFWVFKAEPDSTAARRVVKRNLDKNIRWRFAKSTEKMQPGDLAFFWITMPEGGLKASGTVVDRDENTEKVQVRLERYASRSIRRDKLPVTSLPRELLDDRRIGAVQINAKLANVFSDALLRSAKKKESGPGTVLTGDALEPHVAFALELARGGGDGPIDAARALDGVLRVAHRSPALLSESLAFKALRKMFLRRKIKLPPQREGDPQPAAQFELTPGFAQALTIARSAVPERPRVWGRTLITAILFAPEPLETEFTKPLGPHWRGGIQDDWATFLRRKDSAPGDWNGVLERLESLSEEAPEPPGLAPAEISNWLAKYSADTGTGEDKLEISRDVQAMAAVIASDGIEPPLSIGVFGKWGSGKTFFMEKLDEAIQKRAHAVSQEQESAPTRRFPYVSRIALIWFNAWHFMDANLWPSLVLRIFEGLAEYIKDPKEELDEARARLFGEAKLSQRELRAAQREHEARQKAREEEEKKVEALEQARTEAKKDADPRDPCKVRAVRRAAKSLLQEASISLKIGGADVPIQQVHAEITLAVADMGNLGSRLVRLWQGWFPQAGFRKGLGLCLTAAALVGIAVYLALDAAGADFGTLGGVFTAISTAVAWVATKLRQAGDIARDIDKKLANFDAALVNAEGEEQRRTESAAARLDRLIEQENEARSRVLELEERERAAEARLQEATAGRLLERFIQERIRSEEYRENLGVISMIREDFERFERLFARDRREQRDGDLPRIERIVLFIDDLDRCTRKRVVEVLQAVHLLLALKLFVVVVAVDSRWLEDALAKAGSLELHVDTEEAGTLDQATPLNYLEKIFQIPYTLRPMQPDGFAEYVHYLTRPAPEEDQAMQEPDAMKSEEAGTKAIEDGEEAGPTTSPEPGPEASDTVKSEESPTQAEAESRGQPAAHTLSPEELHQLLRPEPVVLTEAERDFLSRLGPPVIRTPRAAKRLVNCYRFLRATLLPEDLDKFVQPKTPSYAATLTLLALATGQPRLATRVFQSFDDPVAKGRESASLFLASVVDRQGSMQDMKEWLNRLSEELGRLKPDDLKAVMPLVRKHTFVIESTAGPAAPSSAE